MRILISGVGYAPEVTGIGPYTTGLAEHLAAEGHDVIVATTFPFAPLWRWLEPPPRWRTRERLNGVDLWRTKIVLPPRRSAIWRIIFDSSVGVTSALTALSIPRVDVAICVSPPIQSALTAACIRFKLRRLVVLVKDLPTEAARSVGMLRQRGVLRAGRAVEQVAYKLADYIVVINSAFADYIQDAGVDPAKISVIPDWADTEWIHPGPPDPETRRRLGAGHDDFLLVHAGTMGAKQDLMNVLAAAELLKEEKRIKVAVIGDGQERDKIANALNARRLENLKLLPLQTKDEFSKVLTAADVLLINQAPNVVDSVMPSKLLSYMASGRPVLAAAHSKSTSADLIRRSRCGVLVEPGQPQALAAEILAVASDSERSATLAFAGQNGREYIEQHFNRSSVLRRWDELLPGLLGTVGGSLAK